MAAIATGVDEGADISIAGSDHAVERHGDLLVTGERLKPLHIGLISLDRPILVYTTGGYHQRRA